MKPLDFARANQTRFLSELNQFLSLPSVSTQAEYAPVMKKTAAWLRGQLLEAGFPRADVVEAPGHPIVYAEWLAAGPDAPTILVYGHYDVQPPDPVDEWRTAPFKPTLIGSDLVGRGASDDKGQLYIYVKAAEAFKEADGQPPVNLKYLFEGEEEISSPSLEPFIRQNRELLAADFALISDTYILDKDTPAITYGLRGITYTEVEVSGPAVDLHSGMFGGAVLNPVHVLCDILSRLHDADGRVAIPGFYDQVIDLDPAERAALGQAPFDRQAWLREAGVTSDWGDPDYTIVERTTARPALDVNGIWGGYIMPGAKTVLPSKASAKVSMRLVPNQHPDEIYGLFRQYVESQAPVGVTVTVRDLHGGSGAIVRRDSPEMRAAVKAYSASFGTKPYFVRSGGSIPVVATLQQQLGIETILMGFGLPDDNTHAPNEKMHLPNFYRGIETIIRFFDLVGSPA